LTLFDSFHSWRESTDPTFSNSLAYFRHPESVAYFTVYFRWSTTPWIKKGEDCMSSPFSGSSRSIDRSPINRLTGDGIHANITLILNDLNSTRRAVQRDRDHAERYSPVITAFSTIGQSLASTEQLTQAGIGDAATAAHRIIERYRKTDLRNGHTGPRIVDNRAVGIYIEASLTLGTGDTGNTAAHLAADARIGNRHAGAFGKTGVVVGLSIHAANGIIDFRTDTIALPLMIKNSPGAYPPTIVSIRHSVTAADRIIDPQACIRGGDADSGQISSLTARIHHIAGLSFRTGEPGDAAANVDTLTEISNLHTGTDRLTLVGIGHTVHTADRRIDLGTAADTPAVRVQTVDKTVLVIVSAVVAGLLCPLLWASPAVGTGRVFPAALSVRAIHLAVTVVVDAVIADLD
jgi:hypothetical protein